MVVSTEMSADACQRATGARDPRFDGIFFIGITTTRVYCRPVCPARVTYPERRRFFPSAAAAERAGFRPCLRCRPELAPGRALCDAVSRLAAAAAQRIAEGALNGRSVAELARDLFVSERHLRRAVERELGVSPLELAQTHRLLLAKRLLADTDLSVSRIAYASGFQSLRRFNSVFRERYRLPPNALRRERPGRPAPRGEQGSDLLRLTLSYRPPLAWDALLSMLRATATPGVEWFDGCRYGRTVRLNGASGVVFAEDAARGGRSARARDPHVNVDVSASLVPVLMPLLARLRRLLDLDAEPSVVDAHLQAGGLGALAARRPGLRVPGAIDGFEVAMRILLGAGRAAGPAAAEMARRIAEDLGEPIDTGIPALIRLAPDAERVADAGADRLMALGVPRRRAESIAAVARLVTEGALRLEPGADAVATHTALREAAGVGDGAATLIVMRALRWPDAFPATDRALRRAAGESATAEQLRPWRAYAAMHLWLEGDR
jgi:AraC family transcriptional regulator of adaptative response / DNA-3-methyladenine glycosylase II